MSLRNLLGSALAGLGGLVAVNRRLRSTAELPPALAGHSTATAGAVSMSAYTEAGDPDNPTLVLLHGINAAGSSGEFREIFGALADDYHCRRPGSARLRPLGPAAVAVFGTAVYDVCRRCTVEI